MRANTRLSFAIFIFPIGAFCLWVYWQYFNPFQLASRGQFYFAKYWLAAENLLHGKSAYDWVLLGPRYASAGFDSNFEPLVTVPPWGFLILGPLTFVDVFSAATIWSLISVALALISAGLIRSAVRNLPGNVLWRESLSGWEIFASLLFVPVLFSIGVGHLGAVYALSIAGFLWAVERNRLFAGGLFLALLTIEPFLFSLFILAVLFRSVLSREYGIGIGFAAGLLVLFVLVAALSPQSLWHWPELAWEELRYFIPATFVGALLELLYRFGGVFYIWPRYVLPLVFFFTFFPSLVKLDDRPSWLVIIPPLLCWSLLCAPGGNFSDLSALLVIPLLIVSSLVVRSESASEPSLLAEKIRAMLVILLMIIIFFALQRLSADENQYRFWPALFTLIWWQYARIASG